LYENELIDAARAALVIAQSRRHRDLIEVLSYYLGSTKRTADKYFRHMVRVGKTCHCVLLNWLKDYISGEVYFRDLIDVFENFGMAK
jgi:hypothetical protein